MSEPILYINTRVPNIPNVLGFFFAFEYAFLLFSHYLINTYKAKTAISLSLIYIYVSIIYKDTKGTFVVPSLPHQRHLPQFMYAKHYL